jgi:hypothetical protein
VDVNGESAKTELREKVRSRNRSFFFINYRLSYFPTCVGILDSIIFNSDFKSETKE